MLNNTILTIAIPTFNRRQVLEKTLQSLVPLSNISKVQILVIDNCSNDGTWEWLCRSKDELGITIEQNIVNLGIEGNIIQALLHAKGNYVWLLSDHMHVNVTEVITFINKLKVGLAFTFGYARIAEYATVLPKSYIPIELKKLDQHSLGEIIFFMGNISTFIVNSNYLNQCVRTIFRFSSYSYPQLGVFVHAKKDATFVELPIVSSFLGDMRESKRISYDMFRSRFIGFARALEEIDRLNPNYKGMINYALSNRMITGPLALESVLSLCFSGSNVIKTSEFIFCFRRYHGKIRIFLFVCILLSMLPSKITPAVSKIFFRTFRKNIYQAMLIEHSLRFSSESIKE